MHSSASPSMSLDKDSNTDADGNEIGKLFIGGLSQSTNDASLRAYFVQFGDVEDAVVMMDNRTGRSRGFGYIKFKDAEVVATILGTPHHMIDGKSVDAKQCNINMKGKNSRSLKVFVGGIAPEHDIDIVKNFFSQYGNVTEVNLMLDQSKQRHRGFAFVGFDDESVVRRLIQIHYLTMHGKTVEIKAMEPPNFVLKSSPSTLPTITRFRSDSMVYPTLQNHPVWPPMGYDSRSWMGQPPAYPVPPWPPGQQWYGPTGAPCGFVDSSGGWAPPPAHQWGPAGWYPQPMWPNGQPQGPAGWPSIAQTSGPPPGSWQMPPGHPHYPVPWDGNPPPSSVTVWSNSAGNQRMDYDADSAREDSPSRISSPIHHQYSNEDEDAPPEGAHNYWLYGTKLVSDASSSGGADPVMAYNHVAAGDYSRNNNKLVYNN